VELSKTKMIKIQDFCEILPDFFIFLICPLFFPIFPISGGGSGPWGGFQVEVFENVKFLGDNQPSQKKG
jgi:hypothetical protein